MIAVTKKTPEQYSGDMIVFFVRQEDKHAPACQDKMSQPFVDRAFEAEDFNGKEGRTLLFYPESAPASTQSVTRKLIVGLGRSEASRELFRKSGGTVATVIQKTKAKKILLIAPEYLDFNLAEMIECLTEGIILGSYRFLKYKSEKQLEDVPNLPDEIAVYANDSKAARQGLKLGLNAANAGSAVRDMANEPGNQWTPSHFAEYGRKLADRYGFACKILSKTDMKRLGMGGILSVNGGSEQPPKMVILEYRTGKKVPTLLLVGKGLTFDAGGISLKPSSGMEEMKYDMCGGAAVLATMQAVGEEKPEMLDVVAIVPATENLPGPAALKPGDIITQYGGKKVEVINTDAEGRLILADALAYGIKKYKPDAVVDIATLTGAVIIGLGHHRTGLMTNNDALAQQLIAAGDRSGEPLWRLPLDKEYAEQLKSEIADLKNLGNKGNAGTITAAAFLQEFVGDTTWAHLDIAGTAWNFTKKSYIPKGPSGVGGRTLLELIRAWK